MNARVFLVCVLLAPALLGTPAQAAPPIEPGFIRARPYLLHHLDTVLAASRVAGVSPAARPPIPSPCNATDAGDSVHVTWANVSGEQGYYVFRDGDYVATLAADVTSYADEPGLGAHSYCVMSFNTDGVSDVCCDTGSQTLLSTPSPCSAAPSINGAVLFQWTSSPGALGYRVYRDGTLLTPQGVTNTSFFDNPGAGSHQFCVEAYNGGAVSNQCCAIYQALVAPSAPGPCSASNNLPGSIRLTWTDVTGEDGYLILRDGNTLATVPPDTTTFLDGATGSHNYCVRAFNAYGHSPDCCTSGFGLLPAMTTRLSWGTCSPQVANQAFLGPGIYTLVLSAKGNATTNYGHDSQLTIHPAVPDAWRFDNAGCQTEQRLDLRVEGIGDTCPAMLGLNSLTITSYFLDVDGSAALRLAITYDNITTTQDQRYVLWKIGFDHTHSVAGTDADPQTCDGAATPLNFAVTSQIGLPGGLYLITTMEPGDQVVTWNGGVSHARIQQTTWGRLKGMYR